MATAGSSDMNPRDPLEATRQVAIEVAKEAGRILLEGWGTRPTVRHKGDEDIAAAGTAAAVSGAAGGLHLLDPRAAGGGDEDRHESKLRREANNGKSLH
jgi:hypothetical protein